MSLYIGTNYHPHDWGEGKVAVHLVYDDMLEELVAYTKEREAEGHGQ